MKEITKYHNDFNRINIPKLTELEQNLFYLLLIKIRQKAVDILNLPTMIWLEPQDIQGFSKGNLTMKETTEILRSFIEKIFKADFTILIDDERGKGIRKSHFFNSFDVLSTHPLKEDFYLIEIEINRNFDYLVNHLNANFTAFEYAEFLEIQSRYSKKLYTLLKQFRNTGELKTYKNDWQGFLNALDIPQSYKMSDIEKQILKPTIKELTAERNLFDQARIPFKNLKYEKQYQGDKKGRGCKVIGIIFTFTPQKELESKEPQTINKAPQQSQMQHEILQNKYKYKEFIIDDKIWKWYSLGNSIDGYELLLKGESVFDEKYLPFKNINELESFIKSYRNFVI